MSRRFIGYPTDWTLSVIDDPVKARAAVGELIGFGVADDDLVVMTGPESAEAMRRLGTSTGLGASIRRTMQFMTMDQMPDLHVYELALDRHRTVIGVRVADTERRRQAVGMLQRHGAHFINRFGAWATEEIAPWRGEMPDVPQHMRR